jgi:CRP-like cAMP-binding protein
MNKREALSQVALFSKMSEKHLDKLADLSVPKTFPADTLIIKEGTVGLGMFIITSGRVEVYRGEGEARTTLAVLESGTIVGEMALINDQHRSANVRSLEPTECLLISRDAFNSLIRQEPEVSQAVMSVMADRVRDSQHKLQELQTKVNQTVADVKEKAAQDWTTEDAPRFERETSRRAREGAAREEPYQYEARTESGRLEGDPLRHLNEAHRLVLRATSEWVNTWMGMMGTFMGGMARVADTKKGAARSALREGTAVMPRRYFKSFTGAIDEAMRAYEEVATGGTSPPD